jgi:hypothetical protein
LFFSHVGKYINSKFLNSRIYKEINERNNRFNMGVFTRLPVQAGFTLNLFLLMQNGKSKKRIPFQSLTHF